MWWSFFETILQVLTCSACDSANSNVYSDKNLRNSAMRLALDPFIL
jgi:hypothetical protein